MIGMMTNLVHAPWNVETVIALTCYQRLGYVHEYTCYKDHVLEATTAGWVCKSCGYTQDWALDSTIAIGLHSYIGVENDNYCNS